MILLQLSFKSLKVHLSLTGLKPPSQSLMGLKTSPWARGGSEYRDLIGIVVLTAQNLKNIPGWSVISFHE